MDILAEELNRLKSILNNVSKRSVAYHSSFELFLEIFPRYQDRNKNIKKLPFPDWLANTNYSLLYSDEYLK